MKQLQWCVYLLQCADDSYYCGSTNDLDKRIKTHNVGKGAKYTRSRLPVQLMYSRICADQSDALKQEIAIKKLTHTQKKELANHQK